MIIAFKFITGMWNSGFEDALVKDPCNKWKFSPRRCVKCLVLRASKAKQDKNASSIREKLMIWNYKWF